VRERIIQAVLGSILLGLFPDSGWASALKGSDRLDVMNASAPEVGAILLLGIFLLGAANLLRRRRHMQDHVFESSLKSVSGPTPKAIGRELCPESSVRT